MPEFLLLITILNSNGVSSETVKFTSQYAEQNCIAAKKEVENKSSKSIIIGSLDVVYKAECIKVF